VSCRRRWRSTRCRHEPRRGHHRRVVGHRRGDRARIQALAHELGDAIAIEADVIDRDSIVAAGNRVQQELGAEVGQEQAAVG
jgi:NADP-dependent 3-hydroxy acid dehydrogenase YdfG